MSLLGRIEAYLYSSGTSLFAATSDLTITETTGPVSAQARLTGPQLLSDALTDWQTQLNASALANSYALSWDSTAQAVTIARTAGASTFTALFGGALYRALGYSSASASPAATTFTGDTQARARYDNVRVGVAPVVSGQKVDTVTYQHGRAEVLAFGNHDLHDVTIYLPKAVAESFAESYCIAGRVRIWQDATLALPWSYSYPQGYLDGYVLAVSGLESLGVTEAWWRFRMRLAVPR